MNLKCNDVTKLSFSMERKERRTHACTMYGTVHATSTLQISKNSLIEKITKKEYLV